MEPCQNNTYEDDGFCLDCLGTLGPTCVGCSEYNTCSECVNEYYVDTVQIADITLKSCKHCSEKHTDECLECTFDECTKCINTRYLFGGKCYDCSLYSDSMGCDDKGATSCRDGYFLEADSDGVNRCHRCSDHLDHCDLCTDRNTCTSCNKDFFGIIDGKCTCKGGKNAFYNQFKRKCECEADHYLTIWGCRKCTDVIPDCSRCSVSNEETQVPLGDEHLERTGEYVQCDSCPFTTYKSDKNEHTGTRESKCVRCDSFIDGCISCNRNDCSRCKEAYIKEGNRCTHCNTFRPLCTKCENKDYCQACEADHTEIFGWCVKNLFT